MNNALLRVAVVGHTNTGKTSLVRTLLRSGDFGQVADRGGTTRQVTSATLMLEGEPLIQLYDSPGLENAPELIDVLEAMPGKRHDGPERIALWLGDESLRARFDHESRVLELVLNVDVALYVIDAREPVLEKYQDELAILGQCGRPLLAVLNFTASADSRESEWRQALSRVMLHNVLAFDAVVRDPETEQRLFEKLASLLDDHVPALGRWLEHRQESERQHRQAALDAIAGMLIDLAAARRVVPAYRQATDWTVLKDQARQREQACVDTLLDLYQFEREDMEDTDLPLSGGSWAQDLFDSETLRHYGIRTGKFTGIGAGAGAAVDIGTGGLTLGAGTLAGTLIGTGAGLIRSFGDQLSARVRGRVVLMIDDATLRLLASRQLELLEVLIRRGHASQSRVRAAGREDWQHDRLPRPLRQARFRPQWSSLNRQWQASSERNRAVERLASVLGGL